MPKPNRKETDKPSTPNIEEVPTRDLVRSIRKTLAGEAEKRRKELEEENNKEK
jgi:hypothetical protein